MSNFKTKIFPKSRIATNDICSIGLKKHHVSALIEIDVSGILERINEIKKQNNNISFTSWIVKVISHTIKEYDYVSSYLKGKRELIIFDDINVSILVEKNINGQDVPIPLVIEKANSRTVESINEQIRDAKNSNLSEKDIVLHRNSTRMESLYFWNYLSKHPHFAFSKIGNVAITSIGSKDGVDGWFIPISIHPICFGLGNITKKPKVIDNKIEIREILHMTILLDHDVVDGVQMSKFIQKLTNNISIGLFI
jgi:pyruvate/2-oxoglutarate dehydrogenase complex dihydrolipoamide acyltransferase (E2) component